MVEVYAPSDATATERRIMPFPTVEEEAYHRLHRAGAQRSWAASLFAPTAQLQPLAKLPKKPYHFSLKRQYGAVPSHLP
jgi:hypothetical protein